MRQRKQRFYYIIFDIIATALTWTIFVIFRKEVLEAAIYRDNNIPWSFELKFVYAIVIFPIGWITLHYLCNFYTDPFRKSRYQQFSQTFLATFIGVTFLFFFVLLDDYVTSYIQYYEMYLLLFGLQFFLTLIPRVIITSITNKKINKGKLTFNAIIIGDEQNAIDLMEELKVGKVKSGLKFIGFVHLSDKEKYLIEDYLPNLGKFAEINEIIKNNNVEELVIAIEYNEQTIIKRLLYRLQGINIPIKIIPSMYDILTGKVKMSAIFGIPLIEIKHNMMPIWQQHVKQIFDFISCLLALIISSPLFLLIAIIVKIDSKGPVFFKQERIGKNRKKFKIIKFRTMRLDAEKAGPRLSSKNDSRITKVGRFLRKTRLDELPQFINVIRGEMSLVGPRPERDFYVKLIEERAPYYYTVLSVKPGITGWGQIKNGYTSTIDEMINRLRYDLLYIENRSIFLDFKILFFTIAIVLKKKGV